MAMTQWGPDRPWRHNLFVAWSVPHSRQLGMLRFHVVIDAHVRFRYMGTVQATGVLPRSSQSKTYVWEDVTGRWRQAGNAESFCASTTGDITIHYSPADIRELIGVARLFRTHNLGSFGAPLSGVVSPHDRTQKSEDLYPRISGIRGPISLDVESPHGPNRPRTRAEQGHLGRVGPAGEGPPARSPGAGRFSSRGIEAVTERKRAATGGARHLKKGGGVLRTPCAVKYAFIQQHQFSPAVRDARADPTRDF
jgi:hypothetical protein